MSSLSAIPAAFYSKEGSLSEDPQALRTIIGNQEKIIQLLSTQLMTMQENHANESVTQRVAAFKTAQVAADLRLIAEQKTEKINELEIQLAQTQAREEELRDQLGLNKDIKSERQCMRQQLKLAKAALIDKTRIVELTKEAAELRISCLIKNNIIRRWKSCFLNEYIDDFIKPPRIPVKLGKEIKQLAPRAAEWKDIEARKTAVDLEIKQLESQYKSA